MMKCRRKAYILPVLMIAVVSCAGLRFTSGQEPERQGPWLTERSAEGRFTMTAEMVLRSAAEPQPALKHRLIPDAFDQVAGNSAIYYLKAMGFLEQTVAAKMIFDFREKNRKVADERGLTNDKVPPDSWLDMAPSQLPLAEVKEYLQYTAFQTPLLAEATLRTEFELDRNIRDVESPIAYLLPEIQTMCELARLQSLRCRVAIAEQRVADAIEILHQQFTMARHLGTDEFLVSNLVGAAILAIALQDAIYVVQEPEAPNLYWAFATLPTPMIDMTRSSFGTSILGAADQDPPRSG